MSLYLKDNYKLVVLVQKITLSVQNLNIFEFVIRPTEAGVPHVLSRKLHVLYINELCSISNKNNFNQVKVTVEIGILGITILSLSQHIPILITLVKKIFIEFQYCNVSLHLILLFQYLCLILKTFQLFW